MNFQTLKDINANDKAVLLRADLNVPVDENMNVTDTTRIDRLKPTIDYLRTQKAKIVLASHFGRPKGEVNNDYSLSFLSKILEKQWGAPVKFVHNCIGDDTITEIETAPESSIILLENLRFHAGEESNDVDFAEELSALGDIYVNDAFSTAHREHASTEAITHYLPAVAGLLMEAELNALANALDAPQKPVMAIVGGAKISTKLEVLNHLVQKVDKLVLGGGMANTFLYAMGHPVGNSLCEKDMTAQVKVIQEKAKTENCEIILPMDHIAVREFKTNANSEVIGLNDIADDQLTLDVGPQTIAHIEGKLQDTKTVLWNGPMGVFEMKPFDNGTNKIAQAVAQRTKEGELLSVAGGGDTVSALENAGVANDFSYISTAGGAFLEWIEGKTLPGIQALQNASKKAA